MPVTSSPRPPASILLTVVCAVVASLTVDARLAEKATGQQKKPTLVVKATPTLSFTPSKIRFVAEVKGGPNDYEDLYCPSVEWDWNDDTTSESSVDCEPYQPGKSQIIRRFTIEHVYKVAGLYRVQIRLKRKSRVILSANVQIQVSPGVRDPGLTMPRPF
jgi:hypothetical protein